MSPEVSTAIIPVLQMRKQTQRGHMTGPSSHSQSLEHLEFLMSVNQALLPGDGGWERNAETKERVRSHRRGPPRPSFLPCPGTGPGPRATGTEAGAGGRAAARGQQGPRSWPPANLMPPASPLASWSIDKVGKGGILRKPWHCPATASYLRQVNHESSWHRLTLTHRGICALPRHCGLQGTSLICLGRG